MQTRSALLGRKVLSYRTQGRHVWVLTPGLKVRNASTKGHGTTLALSTLNFLLVRGYLRRGDGLIATPMSRRKERLFEENETCRLSIAVTGLKSLRCLLRTTSGVRIRV